MLQGRVGPGSYPLRRKFIVARTERVSFLWRAIFPAARFSLIALSLILGPVRTRRVLNSASGAVNRTGNLIAFRNNGPTPASLNTAPGFNFLHTFGALDSGVAFDAVRDVLYGVNSVTDEIIAYSTTTYSELFRFPIGEHT